MRAAPLRAFALRPTVNVQFLAEDIDEFDINGPKALPLPAMKL